MAKTQKYRKHTAGNGSRSSRGKGPGASRSSRGKEPRASRGSKGKGSGASRSSKGKGSGASRSSKGKGSGAPKSSKGKGSGAPKSSSNSLQLIPSSGNPSIKDKDTMNKIIKFHTGFITGRIPLRMDRPTEEELEKYFSIIGKNQKNIFNRNGHIFVCSLLKMVHNDNNIDTVFESLSLFHNFTSKQRKYIINNNKLIFDNNIKSSSRVEVIGGNKFNSQEGGSVLYSVYLQFCFLFFIAKTFYFYSRTTHVCNRFKYLDSQIKQVPENANDFLRIIGDTDLEKLYDEMSDIPVNDRWLKKSLIYGLYPLFLSPDVYSTPEFKNQTDDVVRYFSLTHHGINYYLADPSHSITDHFSKKVLEKKYIKDEKLFKAELDKQVALMKVLNTKYANPSFHDDRYYTKKKHDEMRKDVQFFEKTLEQLIKTINDKQGHLQDDKGIETLVNTLQNIQKRIEDNHDKLEQTLKELSNSTDIAIILPDPDYNTGTNTNNAYKLFNNMMGITALQNIEKQLSTTLKSAYNGYIEPYVQCFKRLKQTIESALRALKTNVDTIGNIINHLRSIKNPEDIKVGLQALPTQLTLLISIYHEISSILPELMWYFGTVISLLYSLVPKKKKDEEDEDKQVDYGAFTEEF